MQPHSINELLTQSGMRSFKFRHIECHFFPFTFCLLLSLTGSFCKLNIIQKHVILFYIVRLCNVINLTFIPKVVICHQSPLKHLE